VCEAQNLASAVQTGDLDAGGDLAGDLLEAGKGGPPSIVIDKRIRGLRAIYHALRQSALLALLHN